MGKWNYILPGKCITFCGHCVITDTHYQLIRSDPLSTEFCRSRKPAFSVLRCGRGQRYHPPTSATQSHQDDLSGVSASPAGALLRCLRAPLDPARLQCGAVVQINVIDFLPTSIKSVIS